MNKQKILSVVLGVLTLLWTGFIFSMSLQPADQSKELSGGLLTVILGFLESLCSFAVSREFLHHLIRKLAHFGEFFILGGFSSGFLQAKKKPLRFALFYGALVALTDETIQFFTDGRAMRVTDMAIDILGVSAAMMLLFLFVLWDKKRKS